MNICSEIINGQDNSCPTLQKRFIQSVQLFNWSDIAESTINNACAVAEAKYRVSFSLKEGKKGHLFSGAQSGTTIRGWHSMTRHEQGYAMYTHHVQIVMTRVTEEQKCTLKALGSGLFVGALKLGNYDNSSGKDIEEAIEIYGFGNGIALDEYDYNISETGGVVVLNLSSSESMEESELPMMYASATPGSELEDWEANFATP